MLALTRGRVHSRIADLRAHNVSQRPAQQPQRTVHTMNGGDAPGAAHSALRCELADRLFLLCARLRAPRHLTRTRWDDLHRARGREGMKRGGEERGGCSLIRNREEERESLSQYHLCLSLAVEGAFSSIFRASFLYLFDHLAKLYSFVVQFVYF